jgi:hypothetical protein
VCDIAAIVDIAHAAGALVCVDNSFLTPLYQRPLQLGADISMTSGTKYIGGHGDTTLGMLAVRDPELGQQLYFLQNSEGAGLAPMDCWLALRGLKTVRQKQQAFARAVLACGWRRSLWGAVTVVCLVTCWRAVFAECSMATQQLSRTARTRQSPHPRQHSLWWPSMMTAN